MPTELLNVRSHLCPAKKDLHLRTKPLFFFTSLDGKNLTREEKIEQDSPIHNLLSTLIIIRINMAEFAKRPEITVSTMVRGIRAE